MEYYWEKAPFFQNARLHWASPAASQEQMCSLLLAWDAASSQSQFPGCRSALWAAIWWANLRCSWVCFHKATCSGRLILIPHSKALILTKISKSQVPVKTQPHFSSKAQFWLHSSPPPAAQVPSSPFWDTENIFLRSQQALPGFCSPSYTLLEMGKRCPQNAEGHSWVLIKCAEMEMNYFYCSSCKWAPRV